VSERHAILRAQGITADLLLLLLLLL